ncbi:MAG TPA: SMI1/KNR4 family protein [Archangium sp.]|uniref:SMI1/KNR4 family protein n=1 Tax=Archangium sp. TaxID=1872627 RepID=UPI002ED805A4
MHEWLEGLQKSAKRTVAGVGPDDIRRAETECGVPFPEELGALYRAFDGGELLGDVTLFPLHAPEGTPSVLDKTRLKLESLPAAGVWRFGVKGPHRQLFAARKSAMVEQADSPLPGWAGPLSDDDWIYGTWETEKRELRLYRSLQTMLEVLVPPAEVEEFGDRTFARALSAVQGALSDLSVEYEEGETPAKVRAEEEKQEEEEEAGAEEEEEAGEEATEEEEAGEEERAEADEEEVSPKPEPTREELRQLVVAAAERRVERLRQPVPAEPRGVVKAVATEARSAAKKATAVVTDAAKKVADRALVATGMKSAAKKATPQAKPVAKTPARGTAPKTPAGGAPAKGAAKKAAAKKAPAAKKAAAKKGAAKKAAAKAPAKKGAAKKAPAKKAAAKRAAKAPAKKAAAKKAPARKATGAKRAPANKKGAARGRR